MSEQVAPIDQLKTFTGLIHRQPIFDSQQLDVERYHLTFLDIHGEPLDDDSEVPPFLDNISSILPEINHVQNALLSMPSSWQHQLFSNSKLENFISINSTLAVEDTQPAHIASLAGSDFYSPEAQLLLIDIASDKLFQLDDQQIMQWRAQHKTLCAINVNQAKQYHSCKNFGVDLLQGQFYILPTDTEKKSISPSKQPLMQLLVQLQDPNIEAEELATTINRDIALNYKLLRLVNSAFFGLPKEVTSTKQAIVMLGHKKIKTWASMLCISGIDDKPRELIQTAMVRARMCELLAKYYKGEPDMFFMVGLLSTLDALIDKPLKDVINNLPLSAEIANALIDKEGITGRALIDTLSYEAANWTAISQSAIPKEILVRVYLNALQWAKQLNQQLSS